MLHFFESNEFALYINISFRCSINVESIIRNFLRGLSFRGNLGEYVGEKGFLFSVTPSISCITVTTLLSV